MHILQTLVALFVDIMNCHDAAHFTELVAENYINHNPAVADGRARLIGFMAHWFAAMPDLVVTYKDVEAEGGKVAGRFTYCSTHRNSFVGLPASHAAITIRSIDIWRVENGLFAEHWDGLNLLEVFQQMGPLPPTT